MLLAVAAGAVMAGGPVAAASYGADRPDGSDRLSGADRLDGVWRSDGYGTVFALHGGRLQEYLTTTTSCLPGATARRTDGNSSGNGGNTGPGTGGGNSHNTGPGNGNATGPGFGPGPGPSSAIYTGDDTTIYRFRSGVGGARATLHLDGSVGDRRLRRVPALPGRCVRAAPKGAVATFDVFWQTFRENYPFFAAKRIDWQAVRSRYRPRVHDGMAPAELFAVLREMVLPLHDAHVSLDAGDAGFFAQSRPGTAIPSPALDQQVRRYVERHDLGGAPLRQFANGRIGYAELPDGTGYLRISGFGGYDEDSPAYARNSAALDRALTETVRPGLRRLVLDLRINGGGSDALALQVAERLTDRPHLAYIKRARNSPTDAAHFTRPQRVAVRPAPGRFRFTGPVAVLTGGETYSAGETLTQALMQRPATTLRIGRNTQGVFSDVLERALPNGWSFGLPNEEYRTPSGTTFDGPGIPPDLRTGAFLREVAAGARDSAFTRALAALRSRSR
ncbi:S41 family peptidase [Streptomyces catenulae]|uniref:S41 family peptidase n=1 Tax=Streptomyces catenulae TaxID=66875 RepID=A0ABV2YUI8_9ACTN